MGKSPDGEMMEIKSVSRGDSIGKTEQAISATLQAFEKGEILICRVIEISGKSILFKRDDGQTFSARKINDFVVNVGDTIELMVSDIDRDQYVIKALDIFPQKTTEKDSPNAEANKEASAQSAVFTGSRARALSETLAMVKINPDISPKIALFLAENDIALSKENIEALSSIVIDNVKQGDLLSEIAAALNLETPETAEARPEGVRAEISRTVETPTNTALNTKTSVAPEAETAMKPDNVQMEAVRTENERSAGVILTPATDSESTAVRPENAPPLKTQAPVTPETVPIINEETLGSAVKAQQNTDMGIQRETYAANLSSETEISSSMAKPDDSEIAREIVKHVLSMLYQPTEGTNGGEIKKIQQMMLLRVKELKLLLKDNDIKNKDVLLSKADQIEKQMKVMSEIRKFDCIQIPLYVNKQPVKTAELYVYQYRKRKAESDKDHILIVVSMDTQNMGRVETIINAGQKRVSLKFRVENSRVQEAVVQKQGEITRKIEDIGYRLTEFETALIREKTDITNAIDLLMLEADITREGVDVRI